jgi:hypothetical protein
MKTRDKRRLLRILKNGTPVLLSPRPLGDKIGDVVPIWVEDTQCWERAVLITLIPIEKGSIQFEYQICDRRFGL